MMDFLSRFFSGEGYMPHGHCFFWESGVLWLSVVSDGMIALAYFSIPLALLYFQRKRSDLTIGPVLILFGVFITACGLTHVMGILTIWRPAYWLDGFVKAFTAAASLLTAAVLWPLMPKALRLPSPAALQRTNAELESEMARREQAESALRQSHDELEMRVEARTRALAQANRRLEIEIGDHRETERALRASEARLTGILDSAMDAIITIDESQRIVMFNAAAERVFHCPRSRAVGEPLQQFIPERFRAAHAEHVRRFATAGATNRRMGAQTVLVGRRLDGEEFPIEASISQLTEGTRRLFTVIVRDVSERVKAEEALRHSEVLFRRLNDELEEHVAERTAELTATIAELESFSYSISHDLRAPLRAINGYASIVREDYSSQLNDDGVQFLHKIEANASKMARLIDGLLDFSRLGRMDTVAAGVSMHDLAAGVVAELKAEGDGAHAKVTLGPLPGIEGDAAMLKQVWVNLLSNAFKFSSKRTDPRVDIGADRRGDEVVYWVRDNGVGFDMAYSEKLFGVFNRLHRADEFPGVGVGLAIVRRIIVRHHGRVWATSESGQGTRFFFALPRHV